MKKGTIIFLNGVSCSGKTTISKKLQERLTEPFYSLGLDTFINMSPARSFSDPDGRTVVNKAVSVLPSTIKAFSDRGLNTIVDHVFLKIDNLMDECVGFLYDYPVLFIHVTCQKEELFRRAKERGVSPKTIENQLQLLIPQDTYDLIIDTAEERCVDKIIEMQNCPKKFTAFKTIWSRNIL